TLVGPAMAPLGLGRKRLVDVGQPPELQAQLAGPKALAAPAALPLTQVERLVASLASISTISSEQPNGAAPARAHEDPARHSEARSDPPDPEDLHPIEMIDDLGAVVRNPNMPDLWITDGVRIGIGAVIARDDVP